METAILMIVFCRPETTSKVFEAVRNARPKRLYIACDAPINKQGQIKQNQVLDIFKQVDWNCKVRLLKQDHNLGCSLGPFKAISWFFEHEEEGIILEDDIVPSPEFFEFCTEMLQKYRNNDKIMSISGWNYFYHGVKTDYKYSYYFSRLTSSWGWATWRRSWKRTDLKLESISNAEFESILEDFHFSKRTKRFYTFIFKKIKERYDNLKSWDYQFQFSGWKHRSFTIQPMKNLTQNIGVGEGATHGMPTHILNNKPQKIYPLSYPSNIEPNSYLDTIRIKEEGLVRSTLIVRNLNKIFFAISKKINKLINKF